MNLPQLPATRILFVCTGNICRSPTAEAVVRRLARELVPHVPLELDSAGTHDYHVGEPPDPRALAAAARRGIDMSLLRARQVEPADFDRFHLVLAMDHGHLRLLQRMAPAPARDRVRLFLDYAPQLTLREMPDPYYGGPADFELVLDLAEAAGRGLLEDLGRRPATA